MVGKAIGLAHQLWQRAGAAHPTEGQFCTQHAPSNWLRWSKIDENLTGERAYRTVCFLLYGLVILQHAPQTRASRK
jgi:hypothetical protein